MQVFAVEKDRERVGTIRDNMASLGAANMTIIAGTAPEALKDLPAPDRVFIGGSGGMMKETIGKISEAMPSGIIVINVITIETLADAMQALTFYGFSSQHFGNLGVPVKGSCRQNTFKRVQSGFYYHRGKGVQ